MLTTPGTEDRMEFSDVLLDSERLLWADKPVRAAFIVPPIGLLVFGLLWGCFDGFFVYMMFHEGKAKLMALFAIPFFALHGIPFWILLGWPFYRFLAWKNTRYAVTDKRFLLRSGVIGVDYKSVEFEQVQGVDVDVDLAGRLWDCGDVKLSTGGGGRNNLTPTFADIRHPYEVAKLAKQVSLDVKTDESYPNALRPGENPGYQTQYKPKA